MYEVVLDDQELAMELFRRSQKVSIQARLDELIRYKILSDSFSEWLKRQIKQFEIEIDFNSHDKDSNSDVQLLVKAGL